MSRNAKDRSQKQHAPEPDAFPITREPQSSAATNAISANNNASGARKPDLPKTAITALRDEHSKLLDLAPVGIVTLDESDKILEANLTFAKMLCSERAAMIGCAFSDLIRLEDQTLFAQHMARLGEPDAPQVCDLRLTRPDESVCWTRLDVCMAQGMAGEKLYRIWLSDISTQKRAEAARLLMRSVMERLMLQSSNENALSDVLRLITTTTGLDAAGIRLQFEEHFPYLHTIGQTPDFVKKENDIRARMPDGKIATDDQGRPLLECCCGAVLRADKHRPSSRLLNENAAFCCNAVKEMFADPALPEKTKTRMRNACPEAGYESLAMVPLRSNDCIIGLLQVAAKHPNQFPPDTLCLLEDLAAVITTFLAHKHTEDVLREQQAHLRSLTNNIVSGMVYQLVSKPDGTRRFTYLSEAVRRLYGCTPQDGMENSARLFGRIHPDDRAGIFHASNEANRNMSIFKHEARILQPGGGIRWASFAASPRLLDDGSICWDGIEFDITDRKLIEAALAQARDEAEAANRAKSEFLAVMSHELRTPLNPVLGFSELLANEPNLSNEQQNWLKIIRQRGQDLLRLIGATLDLAKIEAGKVILDLQPVQITLLLKDMTASVAPKAMNKGLVLDWKIAPGLPATIMADEQKLRQILLNLLTNAVKFTQRGSVTLRAMDGNNAQCSRSAAQGEHILLFQVQDTGPGIAPERQASIFKPFSHADPSHAGHGAGLGLTIAKRLVETMNGKLWLESLPGMGCSFFFSCIVGKTQQCPGAQSGLPQAESASITQGPLNILAVDDDISSLMLIEEILAKTGHRVTTAANGKNALAAMEMHAFDIVLLDLRMPDINGLQIARLLREKEHNTKQHITLIAMTACVTPAERQQCLAAGMDGFVPKPIQPACLFETIRSNLAARAPSSNAGAGA